MARIRSGSIGCAAVIACCLAACDAQENAPAEGASRWFKGNTHAHTVLCGHADSSPEAVTEWYHEHGFNFLVLSEHNRFIDPATVEMPWRLRKDFILIPGEEVTGLKSVHTTAFNVQELVGWGFRHGQRSHIIQKHTDDVLAAGGEPILNHPNFQSAIKVEDLRPVERLHFFELYNGHPSVHNFGNAQNPSTEVLWDTLLGDGKVVYGLSSDDAHSFKKWGPRISNPGRGWTMVRAAELTPDAITRALRRGDFYASSGVMLSTLAVDDDAYALTVDEEGTAAELESPILFGRRVDSGRPGWRIELIGPGGEILLTLHDATGASFARSPEHAYVRCKVVFTRAAQEEGRRVLDEFYAWTQPAFSDGRREALHATEPRLR